MASVTSLDQDMKNLRMGKYTAEAASEARNWIESVLNERIPGGDHDLMEGLRDGVVLCKLVNKLTPNTARYKESEMPFKQMENISMFLKICSMPPLSIPAHDLFLTVDLYEAKDPAQVLQTIQSFSRKAHAQKPSVFPQPIGPKLGGSSSNTPMKAKPPIPARGPAVSTWAKPEDEGVTQPAWNIATYGYIGGSNQEKMGVSFGGRRQITSASPHVPSLREKEERRLREEQQAEEVRRVEEQMARRRDAEEEQRAVREEEDRWRRKEGDDRKKMQQEEDRRQQNQQKKIQEDEARREEARRKEEEWEREQMERQQQRQTRLERERDDESRRIKELERELEQARERERLYLQEAHKREQETQAAPAHDSPATAAFVRPVPKPKPKPAIGSKPLPHATLAAQRQRELQDEDDEESSASKTAPTPSTPPPTPPRTTQPQSPAKSPGAFGVRTGTMIGRGGKVGETLIEREIRLERERQRDWERNQELLKEERSKMTPEEIESAREGLTSQHDSKRYYGGANQGNMGVNFGSKRQIIGNPP